MLHQARRHSNMSFDVIHLTTYSRLGSWEQPLSMLHLVRWHSGGQVGSVPLIVVVTRSKIGLEKRHIIYDWYLEIGNSESNRQLTVFNSTRWYLGRPVGCVPLLTVGTPSKFNTQLPSETQSANSCPNSIRMILGEPVYNTPPLFIVDSRQSPVSRHIWH